MTKQRERSELEFIRGENRKLRSENKHLRKQLGKSNKIVQRYEEQLEAEKEDTSWDEQPEVSLGLRCPKCEGIVEKADLGIRLLYSCSECTYRKTTKK